MVGCGGAGGNIRFRDENDSAYGIKQTDNRPHVIPYTENGDDGVKLRDNYGWSPEATPIDELRVVTPFRVVGSNFDGATLDSNFWDNSIANSASIAQANSEIVLSSGTNAAGSVKLYSVRRARYVSGSSMVFRAVIKLSDSNPVDNTRIWGVAFGATMPTITDGAYFKVSGDKIYAVTLRGTTENQHELDYIHDENATTYEIYWTNTRVYFVIVGDLVYTHQALSESWAATMNHYIYLSNVNSGNTTNVTLICRVASIRRLGAMETSPTKKYQSGTTAGVICKYGPGNIHGILISGVVNNSAITLYDNTAASGDVIWSSGTMGAQTQPFDLDFHNLPFFIGLTLVIAAANSTVTIIYE